MWVVYSVWDADNSGPACVTKLACADKATLADFAFKMGYTHFVRAGVYYNPSTGHDLHYHNAFAARDVAVVYAASMNEEVRA